MIGLFQFIRSSPSWVASEIFESKYGSIDLAQAINFCNKTVYLFLKRSSLEWNQNSWAILKIKQYHIKVFLHNWKTKKLFLILWTQHWFAWFVPLSSFNVASNCPFHCFSRVHKHTHKTDAEKNRQTDTRDKI